jgi:hypothetical protein
LHSFFFFLFLLSWVILSFCRKVLYEITSINHSTASLRPFHSFVPTSDLEQQRQPDFLLPESPPTLENVPLSSLSLLEKNSGKVGVLNEFLKYYRFLGRKWFVHGSDHYKLLFAIVDGRQLISKPKLFWNYALPYFATPGTSEVPSSSAGEGGGPTPPPVSNAAVPCFHDKRSVLVVQYPRSFLASSLNTNDRNEELFSSSSTSNQALLDCASCSTAGDSNSIWDMSNPDHWFSSSCDNSTAATSHRQLANYKSIYICQPIVSEVGKNRTESYSSLFTSFVGSVELFYLSLCSQWKAYSIILVTAIIYAAAWGFFGFLIDPLYGYIAWLVLNIVFCLNSLTDLITIRQPFRDISVAFSLGQNTLFWLLGIFSPIWTIVIPLWIGMPLSPFMLALLSLLFCCFFFLCFVLSLSSLVISCGVF